MAPPREMIFVNLDKELHDRLFSALVDEQIDIDDLVSLYLRSWLNSVESGKALDLNSKMPFGKYRGERVEVIARAEPGYIRYLLTNGKNPARFTPAVLALIEDKED